VRAVFDLPVPSQETPVRELFLPRLSRPKATPTSTATQQATATNTPTMMPTATNMPTNTPTATATRQNTPTATATQQSSGPCPCHADVRNCSHFSTQSQAQACFNYCVSQGAGDIHKLDGDNDGEACESLPPGFFII
jgi:hypothetical protein